ncbi:MAG: cytochrome c family protein [Gemmataceae bacterium]
MAKRTQIYIRFSALAVVVGLLGVFIARQYFGSDTPRLVAQEKPFEKPPAGQTFVGSKECASCHFDQFLTWRETKHAKGFEVLPAKYQDDASCLKCHATGHGQDTGFVSKAKTPGLAGASCESCHGPGSKHAEIAKSFGKKKLSKDEEKYVRSSIYLMQPKNVCVDCHLSRAHKKHPDYEK